MQRVVLELESVNGYWQWDNIVFIENTAVRILYDDNHVMTIQVCPGDIIKCDYFSGPQKQLLHNDKVIHTSGGNSVYVLRFDGVYEAYHYAKRNT